MAYRGQVPHLAYGNFAGSDAINQLTQEIREIVQAIGPLLILPVTKGSELVGCICVDSPFAGTMSGPLENGLFNGLTKMAQDYLIEDVNEDDAISMDNQVEDSIIDKDPITDTVINVRYKNGIPDSRPSSQFSALLQYQTHFRCRPVVP